MDCVIHLYELGRLLIYSFSEDSAEEDIVRLYGYKNGYKESQASDEGFSASLVEGCT